MQYSVSFYQPPNAEKMNSGIIIIIVILTTTTPHLLEQDPSNTQDAHAPLRFSSRALAGAA